MSNITYMERMKKNEAGFTFIELLIASLMALVILGLLAHVFRAQQKDFAQQTGLNTLQANGRAATDFVARSVQNAGFNVKRGTRFLSASDHYLTAVYDANNDNVISNDEVMTYTIANVWDGTADTDFSFVSYFDVDDDGVIQSGENPTINVQMTASVTPFNLYKVTPDASGTAIERSMIARDIDSMVIRYYDRSGQLLPILSDTDGDGVGDTAVDADADGIPDSGNWTYTFPTDELNDIRKVEIDVLARSHKPNPRGATRSGSYTQGSLAALVSGSTAYSDTYDREDFTGYQAPRNLVMSPWGSVDILATPVSVGCPGSATVLATLLDTNGDPISGETINFTATGAPSVTTTPGSVMSDGNGEGTSVIDYDWSSPNMSSTVSGSALVDDGNGNLVPIYNATPVTFSSTGGGFYEPFDGSQTQPWTPLVPFGDDFEINVFPGPSEEYRSELPGPGVHVGSLNGCDAAQDYVIQTNFRKDPGLFPNFEYLGIILRNQDQDDYYWVRIEKLGATRVIAGRRVAGINTTIGNVNIIDLVDNTTYTLKAQIKGTEIKAKFWTPADPNDPAADEPIPWDLIVNDGTFTSGKFGLEALDSIFRFDNLSMANAP